jgi:phage shock protein A
VHEVKIFDRLGLLIRADAHGVMDRLEERSLLVKQHLRDAELALEHDRLRMGALEEEARRLETGMRRLESRIAAIDADVALAIERGEDELARYAVRRLLPQRAALGAMRERVAEVAAARERLAGRLREREASFASLRARARARLDALERRLPEADSDGTAVSDEEVELELLRRSGVGRPAGEASA